MEGVIGFVWRYGKNDYGIEITDFDKKDEKILMDMYTKYGDADRFSGCRENAENCSVKNANIEYWEEEWNKRSIKERRKKLAKKIYEVGAIKTDVFYDYQSEEQPSVESIEKDLETYKGAAYQLESLIQFCDGSQDEEDHKMFFEISMDIIHYMECFSK